VQTDQLVHGPQNKVVVLVLDVVVVCVVVVFEVELVTVVVVGQASAILSVLQLFSSE